jgi:hypothetical protein
MLNSSSDPLGMAAGLIWITIEWGRSRCGRVTTWKSPGSGEPSLAPHIVSPAEDSPRVRPTATASPDATGG